MDYYYVCLKFLCVHTTSPIPISSLLLHLHSHSHAVYSAMMIIIKNLGQANYYCSTKKKKKQPTIIITLHISLASFFVCRSVLYYLLHLFAIERSTYKKINLYIRLSIHKCIGTCVNKYMLASSIYL